MTTEESMSNGLAVIRGIPLSEEPGIGALTLGGYLREVCEKFGPNEAANLWQGDSVERWTYDELWSRSNQVARALIACGVGKGTRVGILMTNRLEFLSGMFGTALAGGVGTTMSTFSTAAEMEVIMEKAACSVVLLERKVLKKDFAEMLAELDPAIAEGAPGQVDSQRFPFLRYLASCDSDESFGAVEGWSAFLARGESVRPEKVEATAATVAPADPGVLFFSSGSTGKPKGILSAHRGVCLQLWRWRQWYAVADDVRCWTANGYFWSGNFGIALGSTLSSGGCLLLQRYFDPVEALEIMEKERVTFLYAWPHQWAQLTDAPNWLDVDLSSMKYLDCKSTVAQHPTINTDYREPHAAYGNTETFTLSSVYPANTPEEVIAGSHGLPVAGMTFRITDPETGSIVRVGELGEITVKGPTLMLGYVGVPLDEVLDEDGFLHTGDGGFVDEQGRLHWEGRINDIIKTGGANVSPIEIDAVIVKCPGVKVAQTVGVPDDLLGELVVTCIVPMEGATLEEAEVQAFAKQELASYKVPRKVLFFEEDELETTGTNKIKTADLRKLAASRLGADNG